MSAAEVCDGVFAGQLEKTVQFVAGGKSFERRTSGIGVVIDNIKEGRTSGRSWLTSQELCEISVKEKPSRDAIVISFSGYASEDVGDLRNPEGTRRFSLGREAVANTRSAGLFFECVSPQLEGSERSPARIRGGLGYAPDRGDAVDELVTNLAILHAASLAVAEELECEGDGGLPKKLDPDMRPLP
ncbi:hypothetical protein [Streptomyces sp. NPDC057718]|uniref:hypothetical protein n=1 Tax=Streptomyces sp. NPDC057718 TaxID=3346225 RepID=UPI00369D3051